MIYLLYIMSISNLKRRFTTPMPGNITEEETGVLLYVALKDRRAAVFAGEGIFGSQKPEYW